MPQLKAGGSNQALPVQIINALPPSEPAITKEAADLLKAASKDEEGMIFNSAVRGGLNIQAGGVSFGGENGRERAKWESALNELV